MAYPEYFYQPAANREIAYSSLRKLTGFNPDSDQGTLAVNGIHYLNLDPDLSPAEEAIYYYGAPVNYTLNVDGLSYDKQSTILPRDLNVAKDEAKRFLIDRATTQLEATDSDYNDTVISSLALFDEANSPVGFQSLVSARKAIISQLSSDLTSVNVAADVPAVAVTLGL